ncbi:MAG: hypothetical protein J6S69_04480, partial [Proteobacteria bacterium]|nr:hypothetical protein [Pseudomonadota bacterium]
MGGFRWLICCFLPQNGCNIEFAVMSVANQSALSCWERAAAKRHGVRSKLTKKVRKQLIQRNHFLHHYILHNKHL